MFLEFKMAWRGMGFKAEDQNNFRSADVKER